MDLINSSNLKDLFAATIQQMYSDSSFGGASGDNIFFTFSWPASVLEENNYMNPWSPSNATGSMLAVENISELVDTIPSIGKYYTPSGSNVSDVYGLILNGYTLPTQSSGFKAPASAFSMASDADMVVAEEKVPSLDEILKTNLDDLGVNVQKAKSPVGDVVVANTTSETEAYMLQEQKRSNELAQKNAELLSKGLSIPKKRSSPPAAFAAQADSVSPAPRSSGSLATIFAKANAIYINTALASIKYPQLKFHPSDILPSNFADEGAASQWANISLQYRVTVDGIAQNVNVSYRFCRVDIVRAWMVSYLLSMQGWGIQGQPKGWLSTGNSTNNPGVFPLMPVSMILCRNLVISSEAGDFEYNVDGLQVLAYISKVIPFMPTI